MLASLSPRTLLLFLSCMWLTTQATQPDCAHVADFDDCQGDTIDFCPKGLTCGCKEQKPICKCHAYRSGWQNYWYMGPKCDSLWSSLDLILIAAFSAVALAVTIAIIMQWINYCKNRPKEGDRHSSTPAKGQRLEAEYNEAYIPDSAGVARQVSQPQRTDNEGDVQNFKFPRLLLKNQLDKDPRSPRLGAFNYLSHQPLRRAAPMEDVYPDPPPRFGHLGYLQDDDDDDDDIPSAEENPFSAMPMQQFPKPASSLFPQIHYPYQYPDTAVHDQVRRNQPVNYPGAARSPYRIGQPPNIYT